MHSSSPLEVEGRRIEGCDGKKSQSSPTTTGGSECNLLLLPEIGLWMTGKGLHGQRGSK